MSWFNGFGVTLIVVVLVVALVLWAVVTYNNLVSLRLRVSNGWSQIDVLLKQRTDLIPNLVETVRGYAAHESQVFTQVTQARAQAVQTSSDPQASISERVAAESALGRAILNLTATAEAYPQLQANQNFLDLQSQLRSLEDKISYARQFYNDVVMKYNERIQSVPSNIIAGIFRFKEATFFQIDDSDKQVPQVRF